MERVRVAGVGYSRQELRMMFLCFLSCVDVVMRKEQQQQQQQQPSRVVLLSDKSRSMLI